jgi:hypothetical protein
MAKKSKNTEKKLSIDHQVFRISQFRHRFAPPPKSNDTTHPFEYLRPREIEALGWAFLGYGLNINNSADRDYLLAMLAYGIFGDEWLGAGRPPGSKKQNSAAKLIFTEQVNAAEKAIFEETGKAPTCWAITERIWPGRDRDNLRHQYNRVCELYRLQKSKKK